MSNLLEILMSNLLEKFKSFWSIITGISPAWMIVIVTALVGMATLFVLCRPKREEKISLANTENSLDQEAFRFITSIPNHIGSSSDSGQFIGEFESKILDSVAIRNKKRKQFYGYIKLANDFYTITRSLIQGNTVKINKNRVREKCKNIFTNIIDQAEELSKTVDEHTRKECMQRLWTYGLKNLWEKNIFLIQPTNNRDSEYPPYFVYSDVSDNDKEGHKNARKIVQKDFNMTHTETTFYENEKDSGCSKFYPSDRNCILRLNEKRIVMELDGKLFTFHYKKPHPYQ